MFIEKIVVDNTAIKTAKIIGGTLSGWLLHILLYFLPIKDLSICIFIAFLMNFSMGILAGILVNCETLNIKKALYAFFEIAVYLVIVTCGYTWGEKLGNLYIILDGISILTWSWIYMYLVNFLKNAGRIAPNSKRIRFAHYILSLEFIRYLPILRKFEKKEEIRHNKRRRRKVNTL
jgi:hypothetical protein